jgi:hypothetical protein
VKELLLLCKDLDGILLKQIKALEGLLASINLSSKGVWKKLREVKEKCTTGLSEIDRQEYVQQGFWLQQRIGNCHE